MHQGYYTRKAHKHEHTRLLATVVINSGFNAPKRPLKPKDLYHIPEIDGEVIKSTAEEIERFRERMSKKLGREIHFVKTAQA